MNQKLRLFKSILLILPLFTNTVFSQCTSSSARNAVTAASVSFTGSKFGYDIPNNALAADNVYATATAILSVLSGPTQNLTLTNFGFSIPSTATICGVIAMVKKKAANINVLSTVSDNSVKLVKNGAVTGTNKALAGNWTTSNTVFSYGGDADTWGLTLTPADVNAINFGLAFSANISGTISLIPSAQIDNIQLTVYYTQSTLPVILSEFKATVDQTKVMLMWKSEKETGFDHYEVERSNDGYHFEKIASVMPSIISKEYSYVDAFPEPKSYYRLRMVDIDGSYRYSLVVTAKLQGISTGLSITPNPVKDVSTVHIGHCRAGKYRIEVVNASGQIIANKTTFVESNLSIPLSMAGCEKGLYMIRVYSQEEGFVQTVKLLKE